MVTRLGEVWILADWGYVWFGVGYELGNDSRRVWSNEFPCSGISIAKWKLNFIVKPISNKRSKILTLPRLHLIESYVVGPNNVLVI